MLSFFIKKDIQEYRNRIDELLKDLHSLTIDIKNENLADTVAELRVRITEPFMFVIVGEVKAGKSSFINALLDTGREICKVAAMPMTDTIQQIVWGENESVEIVNEYLRKIYQPVEILKEICIVDTPGTNTIVAHHQEITERFIPGSDLIVFVFDAKNPYRQSAWDFFNFIHAEWRKKIIFVLQQKDIMEPDDLMVNEKGVLDYAKQRGIESPQVFSVSAKKELAGDKIESGFDDLRKYIADNITGGKAPMLKLKNNITLARNISDKIQSGLLLRKAQFEADKKFRAEIKATIENQSRRSNSHIDMLNENLINAYNDITARAEAELDSGLGFITLTKRSFSSIFNKENSTSAWLKRTAEQMEQDLNTELPKRLGYGVNDVAESIQQMAKVIDLKIRQSETILKDNHDIFGDIADRRANVLRDLQQEFSTFINRTETYTDAGAYSSEPNFAPNLVQGGGMAVIGVVLATVTQGAVMDITGGVLTAVGLLFAGVTISLKKGKIMSDFRNEVTKGRQRLQNEIDNRLKTYVSNIGKKIDANFVDFDEMLALEGNELNIFYNRFDEIGGKLKKIENEIL